MKLKFIIALIEFVLKMLEMSMEEFEKSADKDADGFPFLSDYGVCSYFYSEIKDVMSNYKMQVKNEK